MSMDETASKREGLARLEIERTYRERRRGLLAWALRFAPDAATAEDVLQDAFIRAVANADALGPVEDLAAWIFSVMRNRFTDLWRGERARRRAGAVDISDDVLNQVAAEAGFDARDELIRREMLDALRIAVDALPAPQREVINAQALGDTGFSELAKTTGVSIDTLMARKRYAIRKLSVALKLWIED